MSLRRQFLIPAFALVALTAPLFSAFCQTNATFPENRYLLVVETSRSMQRRSDGILGAVQQVLNSGAGGQMRHGDSLGIWTYNEELYPGRFPLQHWSPEMQSVLSARTIAFLKDQKFEKQATFVPVLPALEALVKKSPFLTVMIVSSGEQKIMGTPFDDQINTLYASWAVEQQKARMPIVTILRAKAGKFTDFSVNASPWPVEMPPLPQELLVGQTPVKKSTPAPVKSPPPTIGRSIIVSGRKAGAAETNSPAPVPTSSTNEAIGEQIVGQPPNTPDSSAPLKESPPAPVSSPIQSLENSKTLSPPAISPVESNQPKKEKASSATVQAADLQSVGAASNQLVVRAPPTTNRNVRNSVAGQNDSNQSTGSLSKTVSDDDPKSEKAKQSASSRALMSVPVVSTAPKLFFDSTTTLIAATLLVAILLVLVWIWVRRSRSSRHVSIITRSLDREKPGNL